MKTEEPASFPIGSLVKARGREWVVLPDSQEDLLILRPLGGSGAETAGIYLPLEKVEPATFSPPDPKDIGDYRSSRLLRDALRLGFRSSAGPFRSFANIAVDPRPYQLVPLLMALKLDPVRMLIADDVGIGKTIEAGLIARELLDQGAITRLAVLTPPHLAEQWQKELAEKFHIEAEAVLPSTAARLERGLPIDQTLFTRYPFVVVSMDFIKSDRRWMEFARTCPPCVIVDEAHTCANPSAGRRSHQRYRLLSALADDPERHVILVTATPHSGKEEGFQVLLKFLDPLLADIPQDLTKEERRKERTRLARHLVQRRRGDIVHYLGEDTTFPDRESEETTYALSKEYRDFFHAVLRYCRQSVRIAGEDTRRQRVRWWAALGLLRAIGSSPAAAAATLRARAKPAEAETLEEADELGRRAVFDMQDEEIEGTDVSPGADPEEEETPPRRRLLELAKQADALVGSADNKLKEATKIVKGLVAEGFSPIVFCRFIDTAEYVAAALRSVLPKGVEVQVVTGRIPHADREQRVTELGEHSKRVLVASECLSEGVNLQELFDAVVHYDLSWNPTRHEQREGRVDRFGQTRPTVRTVMFYGSDNPIDGIVLDVLIRKHKAIRSSTGVAVPIPEDPETVLGAILEGLLLRGREDEDIEGQMALFERDVIAPRRVKLHEEWDAAADREKASRTIFAQHTIDVEEVARELNEARSAVGTATDIARFTRDALEMNRAVVSLNGALTADLTESDRALKDLLGREKFVAAFSPPPPEGHLYLNRTHPLVHSLAAYVLEDALDPHSTGGAARAGAIRTSAVTKATTLLLLRLRHHLIAVRGQNESRTLAEEAHLLAFTGQPSDPLWLSPEETATLLEASPDANVLPEQATDRIDRVLASLDVLAGKLTEEAQLRADALLESHLRVREGAKMKSARYAVEPKLPVDLLGIYVYLPSD
jgi:superfamily II DNA or RNA helicase